MRYIDKEDRASWGLFWLCFLVYVVVSMSKSAYSASMAAIISDGLFTKSMAGIINSGFYLLYGGAQLLCGKFIDKTPPTRLMSMSLIGSALSVMAMGFSKNFTTMLIIWTLGGLVQFALWPAVLRILAEHLLPMHRQKAMTYISFGYCVGMLLNYLGAAVVLEWLNWRFLFIIEGSVLLATLILWVAFAGRLTAVLKEANATYKERRYEKTADSAPPETKKIGLVRLVAVSGTLFLLIPSFIRASLDLGIKSWVPTMIMESYSGISASFATMLTMTLLVVNLSGVFLVNFFYPKYIKNASAAFFACFALALPFTALLLLTGKISVWLVVLLLMIVTTLMYAGNRISVVIIPSFFSDYGRVGSIAAIINAIASFGALASNYGFGLLADTFGWSGTIISWVIMAGIAAIFCFAAMPLWKKFTAKQMD